MKRAGWLTLGSGLLVTLITGINYRTKEKIVEFGELEITAGKTNVTKWIPLIGLGSMMLGGVLIAAGGRE